MVDQHFKSALSTNYYADRRTSKINFAKQKETEEIEPSRKMLKLYYNEEEMKL